MYHSDLTVQETEEVLCYMFKEHIVCIIVSKFTFEKEIKAFPIEINLSKVK